MGRSLAPGAVVVGVDGSKAAIHAALWAVDEALSRDVPLRLLHSIVPADAGQADPEVMARELATAEAVICRAVTAIEATHQPVKIETEIAQALPISSLIHASASAAMVCVGAVGLRHFQPGRVGSTAAALATSARCPVAIIRGQHDRLAQPGGAIVVEVGVSPDNDAMVDAAMEEARLRGAAVQAVVCQRTGSDYDETVNRRDPRALADLNRRLARWRRLHPSVEVESVAVRGSLVDHLAFSRVPVRLVIVAAQNRQQLGELVGATGSAVLKGAASSLLVVNHQHL